MWDVWTTDQNLTATTALENLLFPRGLLESLKHL